MFYPLQACIRPALLVSFFTLFDTAVEPIEAAVGNVSVTLLKGDLIAESTDAVVNPTDAGLSLSGAVSRSLLQAGGKQIETELKQRGSLEETYALDLVSLDLN